MNTTAELNEPAHIPTIPAGAQAIDLGAGCFWCTESVYQQLPGVLNVTSGYMGGQIENPTYKQICEGDTGHAEISRVVFDPQQISLESIFETFWKMHDPTTLNRQGNDVGTQYRSAIYYADDHQRAVAEESKRQAQEKFGSPIVTEITRASEFYPAENYHQDYYRQNKMRNSYCAYVITPKLQKLGLKS